MKIRTGFVSNSSSASFMLTIFEKMESLIDIFKQQNFFFYHLLDDTIEKLELGIKYSEQTKWVSQEHINDEKEKLTLAKKILENQYECKEDEEYEKEITQLLNIWGVKIENNDEIILTWHTAMLNEYLSSIPAPVLEIMLNYKFNKPNVKIEYVCLEE